MKILFSVKDRCREGLYLQGQAQTYITIGNVETSFICHNWLSWVSVCLCVFDQTSHGRTGLLYNYRTPVEVILTKILLIQMRGWPIAEPTKKLLTQKTWKRFQHETLRGKVEIMTLHIATSVMFPKVLCLIYGEDSFYIKALNKCRL